MAVLEFFLDSVADLEMEIWSHRDVPLVEEGVNILAKQYSITYVVRSVIREWPNVRRIQNMKHR